MSMAELRTSADLWDEQALQDGRALQVQLATSGH